MQLWRGYSVSYYFYCREAHTQRFPRVRAARARATAAPLDRVAATAATSEIPAARCCRIDRLISVARVAETFSRRIVLQASRRRGQAARQERQWVSERKRETERERRRRIGSRIPREAIRSNSTRCAECRVPCPQSACSACGNRAYPVFARRNVAAGADATAM